MKISKKTVFYGTFMLTMSSVVLQSMGFIYRILLSRIAGAEAMGIHQLVMPVYSVIISFTMTGLVLSVTRISAENWALGDKAGIKYLMRIVLYLFAGLFTLVSFVFIAFSDEISIKLLNNGQTKTALLFLLPCLFLTGIENLFKACFYGVNKVIPPIISELSEQIIRIAAVISLFYFVKPKNAGEAAALIILGMIISEMFSSTGMSLFFRKYIPDSILFYDRKQKSILLKKILTIAAPVCFAGLINNLINCLNTVLIPRRLIASSVLPVDALISFGIMFGMTLPLLMLPSAFIFPITTVIVPKISESMALKNTADIKRKTAKVIQVTGLIALPAMAFIIPLGRQIADILYNQPMAGSYITPLAVATIFAYYHITTGSILNGAGRQKIAALSIVASGVVELLIIWFAVGNPMMRMAGFVLGYFISSVLGALINFIAIKMIIKIKIRWANWFLKPLFAALFEGFIIRILFLSLKFYGVNEVLCTIICIAAGLCVYLSVLRICGISFVTYLKKISK